MNARRDDQPAVRRLLMALLAGGVVVLNKSWGSTSRQNQLYSLAGLAAISFRLNCKESQLIRRGRIADFGPGQHHRQKPRPPSRAAVDAELSSVERPSPRCRRPPLPRWRDERQTV